MVDESGLAREQSAVTKPERRAAAARAAEPPPTAPDGPAHASVLPAGTRVGRYEIVRPLAAGGMGTVYEAMDARLHRRVALKVLSSRLRGKRKAAKRFAIEAQAAARLVHPNVVGIYDFDMECAIPYMAMELLEGETLGSEIARGPLAVARLADVMLGVCAGVHAAHRVGIVHRDLKPSNIFLCSNWRGRDTARVLDFGISKVGGIASSDLTETGDIVGTSQYLSPEQAAGARHVTSASDQYSLGVVMYECVTQRTPQQGQPIYRLLRNVAQGSHVTPSALRADLSPALEAIIERAMRVRPKDRFGSVYELGRAIFPFASAAEQQQWSDYYRFGPGERLSPQASQARNTPLPAPEAPLTLRRSDEALPAWQARTTRTTARGPAVGRRSAGRPSEPPLAERPRKVIYSVVVGTALAVAALAVLLLALRT
jgi:serine/threonine protein kinase